MLGNRESKYNTETRLTQNNNQTYNYIAEQRLNYLKDFGQHRVDAMMAMTYEKNNYESINAYKSTALGNDDVYRVLDAQTKGAQASGGRIASSMLSYLLRLNYSYADKYLATISYRADGSSRFAKDNRWGYFPSVSLGWKISQEEFFKNLGTEDWLSILKIRAGWGQNGNQRIDSNAPLTLIGTDISKQWWFGNGYSQGYVPTYTGNRGVKWETSEQTNLGLDMSFFNNSLDVTTDFYIKNTKDMLLTMPIPVFGSYPNNPFFNAGDLKNTGFELSVNYKSKIGKNFNWNVGANVSTYKTEVTSLVSEYLTGTASRTYVGGPLGRFWGYKLLGIFQNQAEIDNYKDKNGLKYQPNAAPGDFKFAKLGEAGVINDADDRTFIGDPNPDLIFGINLGFEVSNFDFSMSLQGVLGNDIWNQAKGGYTIPGMQNSLAEIYTNSWRKEGDKTKYPRITTVQTNNNFRASSFHVEDGSYARLQNVQLGYNLPKQFVRKSKQFSGCRLYISGQNLLTLTRYSGLDPEIGENNPLNMGVDNVRYPIYRSLIFGCNLQF
jgi:TonB-linked SusC/RagA family outer membrane protein